MFCKQFETVKSNLVSRELLLSQDSCKAFHFCLRIFSFRICHCARAMGNMFMLTDCSSESITTYVRTHHNGILDDIESQIRGLVSWSSFISPNVFCCDGPTEKKKGKLLQQCASRIDAVFRPFLVDTSINRRNIRFIS